MYLAESLRKGEGKRKRYFSIHTLWLWFTEPPDLPGTLPHSHHLAHLPRAVHLSQPLGSMADLTSPFCSMASPPSSLPSSLPHCHRDSVPALPAPALCSMGTLTSPLLPLQVSTTVTLQTCVFWFMELTAEHHDQHHTMGVAVDCGLKTLKSGCFY